MNIEKMRDGDALADRPGARIAPPLAAFTIAMMVALTLQIGVLPSKMIAVTKKVVAKL